MVVAQYVITAVPDPEATLDEFARVSSRAARSSWSIISAPRAGLRARVRAGLRAAGAAARLAAGIPLAAAGAMGRRAWRRARGRTPADAAARAFFADPVRPHLPFAGELADSGRAHGEMSAAAGGNEGSGPGPLLENAGPLESSAEFLKSRGRRHFTCVGGVAQLVRAAES